MCLRTDRAAFPQPEDNCSLSETEVHWRDFLRSLADRDMHGLRHIVSDDHLRRRQVHLTWNAMAHVSRPSARVEVASDPEVIFNAADEEEPGGG